MLYKDFMSKLLSDRANFGKNTIICYTKLIRLLRDKIGHRKKGRFQRIIVLKYLLGKKSNLEIKLYI